MGYKYKGIDIGAPQKTFTNYAGLKASGIDFVILRASYGCEGKAHKTIKGVATKEGRDSCFEKHYAGLKAVNMPIGIYQYSMALNVQEAIDEANALVTILKGKSINLPVYFDIEDNTQLNLGKALVTSMVKAWCETITNAGYKAGFYSYTSYIDKFIDRSLGNTYQLWEANSTGKTIVAPIWQYGQEAGIAGYAGKIDVDKTDICFDGMTSSASTSTTNTSLKSNDEIADEVIAGKWGNGADRKAKLTSAGYNYSAVQAVVESKLKNKSTTKTCPYQWLLGDGGFIWIKQHTTPQTIESTKYIQWYLKELEWYNDKIDGICGTKTDAAIKGFQHKHGLVADGKTGRITRATILAVYKQYN